MMYRCRFFYRSVQILSLIVFWTKYNSDDMIVTAFSPTSSFQQSRQKQGVQPLQQSIMWPPLIIKAAKATKNVHSITSTSLSVRDIMIVNNRISLYYRKTDELIFVLF
jgi:hypothetical protein